jgi:asparagine synthase (glutamine-hydrolysing)
VEHLRGMFAFAIVDLRAQRLLIARDHFGQKPLYYTQSGDRFAFASELKCLFALPWVSREPDPAAFLDYCAWLSLPPPRTHFREILKLAAGSLLFFPLAEAAGISPRRYWKYALNEPPDVTALEPAADLLDCALRDSVRAHLRADVPLGVLLSSGLDSRIVSAYSQELTGGGMQTFTVGFGGEDSEAAEAAETAREIGATHHTLEVTAADLPASLERIAWHLDEPVGDPAAFAVLKVCEMAREHVKVLLSGEGADELFGGYDGRYLGIMATLRRSAKLRGLRGLLPRGDPAAAPARWQRLLARIHHSRGSEAVGLRIEGFPGDVRRPRGFTPEQLRTLRERERTIAADLYRPQRDLLSELLVLDLDWQLGESLLQKADKMSMGSSIELRTPLLDVRIAELAARMSSDLKLPPTGPGKLILRHTLARKLREPLTRPKRGFPVPLRSWFAGPLREQIESALFAPNAACLQQLDPRLLRSAWDDFLRGEWDGARLFYALWLYEVWTRKIP